MTQGQPGATGGSTSDPRPPGRHREVVSFVRRSTRMNRSQARAWKRLSASLLTEVPRGELDTSVRPGTPPADWADAFGRVAPLIVEIGSGAGESLVAMARNRPECNVLALEVFTPALASTMIKIEQAGLTNVRLVEADAVDALRWLVVPGGLAELWTFFPDPWPKVRHHKRRLVDAEFATLVAQRMRPGGTWLLATDWAGYAESMLDTLQAHPSWVAQYPRWAPRPEDRPVTRFEQRGLDAGRAVRDLDYRRAE